MEESLAFADSLDLDALKITIGIRIYPHTRLADRARREGVIGDEDDLLRALLRISAPGEVTRLRAAVQPADPGGYWDTYLGALLSFAEQPEREPPGLAAASPLTRGPARRAQPRGPRPG